MILYHYCSNAALVSMIENREIWLSEFSLSNDVMEGKWIREIFTEYCREKNVSPHRLERLLEHLDRLISWSGAAGFCMSENGDLLSQWRGYADDGAGASIGFTSEYLAALGKLKQERSDKFNASLSKVIYDLSDQKALIAEHMDRIIQLVAEGALDTPSLLIQALEGSNKSNESKQRELIGRFLFFFFYLYTLKNPAFAEEKEWRIISHLFGEAKNDDFGGIRNMDFRAKTDRVVPFFRLSLEEISEKAIAEVVLGPKNVTPEKFIEALLLKYGWQGVTVHRSKASYR